MKPRTFLVACIAALAVSVGTAQPAPPAPAPPAASESPSPPPSPVPVVVPPAKPLDLASYTCGDMMQDTADKELQRIGAAFVLSWGLAQEKADPDHLIFDLSRLSQFSGAVGRICAGADNRSRTLTTVVAEQLGVLNGAK